jgi:hypothetical protein
MSGTRLALCDVSGPLQDLFQKLSGSEGDNWLWALNRFLRKENPWEEPAFPVWKTIITGIYKTIGSLRWALNESGCEISQGADDLLNTLTLSSLELRLDLAAVSIEELGYPNNVGFGAGLLDIYMTAAGKGLFVCPAATAPYLGLLKIPYEPHRWFVVASGIISNSVGAFRLFRVGYIGTSRVLDTIEVSPRFIWESNTHFVFLCRKK